LTGRDPDIIGKPLRLSDETVRVVGVMPPEFTHPSRSVGLWRVGLDRHLDGNPGVFLNARYLNVVARIAEGVSATQLQAQLDAMSAGLHAEHGIESAWRLDTLSLLEQAVGDVRGALVGVFMISLVVLAIACANAGALLAARLTARQRELAVMQALGATSSRVWRSILIEMSVLGVLGATIALGLLFVGLDSFKTLAEGTIPLARMIELDLGALGFAALVAVISPLLITLPIAIGLRRRFAENLQGSGKGVATTTRSLTVLPVVGLALATAALIAGGAMLHSLNNMNSADPGYRTADIQAVQMFKGGGPDVWRNFANAVADEMKAQYDVEDVAITTAAPMSLIGGFTIDLQVPDRELPEPLQAGLRRVSPNYLEMLGLPVLRGRGFTDADDAAAPKVAIINETLARRVFGDLDPIGRTVALPLGNGPRVEYRVVGIAPDFRNAGLRNPPEPEVLVPFAQDPWVGMTFLVDAPRAGNDLVERLQQAIWTHDPEEAMTRIYVLQDDVDAQSARVGFFGGMLGGFAVLAALLAAFGTYSVIALVQRQRTTEVGIRLALGADPARIARQVFRFGTVLALAAGVLGSIAAFAVLRLLANQLFGVSPADPGLYLFGIAAVAVMALAASALPAWRAARIAPVEALHYE
jgi:putative ABC transport system permease protein